MLVLLDLLVALTVCLGFNCWICGLGLGLFAGLRWLLWSICALVATLEFCFLVM